MIWKIYLSRFSILVAVLVGLPADAVTREEGKFRVFYLVAADKTEVGAKVYVEPLFLTDGKEVRSLYDYCRALHRGGGAQLKEAKREAHTQLKDSQKVLTESRVTDFEEIQPFCRNESYTLATDSYFLLDNYGRSIRIGAVQFVADVETSQEVRRMQIPPNMPSSGVAVITSVDQHADLDGVLGLRSNGRSYFLMTADKSSLEAIMPVRVPMQNPNALLSRARILAKEKQGMLIEHCPLRDGCESRWYPRAKKWPIVSFTGEPNLTSFLLADIDNDGAMDLAVVMRSSTLQGRPHYIGKHHWSALGFIFANGEAVIESGVWGTAKDSAAIGNLPYLDPVVFVRPGACSFLITPLPDTTSGYIGFHFRSMPRETKECEDQFLWKVVPVL